MGDRMSKLLHRTRSVRTAEVALGYEVLGAPLA
jgi:hypothetical protein